eukprot:4997454-Pleurochrysis_carterae.AAC.3
MSRSSHAMCALHLLTAHGNAAHAQLHIPLPATLAHASDTNARTARTRISASTAPAHTVATMCMHCKHACALRTSLVACAAAMNVQRRIAYVVIRRAHFYA